MTGLMPAGSLDRLQRTLAHSPAYRLLLRNPSAVVFGVRVRDTSSDCRLTP
jgi:hypothetical protein